jgi:hypothetical protein
VDASAAAGERLVTLTGSRWIDGVLFGVAVALIVAGSGTLRVYHSVTVAHVHVARVNADGSRVVVPTPEELRVAGGVMPPRSTIGRLRRRIRAYVHRERLLDDAPPGTRYEWTLRWHMPASRAPDTLVVVRGRRP